MTDTTNTAARLTGLQALEVRYAKHYTKCLEIKAAIDAYHAKEALAAALAAARNVFGNLPENAAVEFKLPKQAGTATIVAGVTDEHGTRYKALTGTGFNAAFVTLRPGHILKATLPDGSVVVGVEEAAPAAPAAPAADSMADSSDVVDA